MSFFNYLEKKIFLGSAQPHKLPLASFDPNYTRLRMRLPDLDGDVVVEPEINRRPEESPKEGLLKVSNEIFRYRFFGCFEKSDNDLKLRGRIIISDLQSQEMINQAMDWLTIKRLGVSCMFNLKDRVSNDLTRNLQVVYLVNIIYLADEEFNQLIVSIRRRECRSCLIFLTYIIDPFDTRSAQRLRVLQEMITLKSIPSPWVVGAFLAIDPWVAFIDSEPNLNYIKQYITKSRVNLSDDRMVACRLAFRLVNIFEQMNQFPIIRFMRTWHHHNSLIAELIVKGLNALKARRRASGASVKYNQDYLLIIIDRSADLVTPILHSTHYQAFVEQELEESWPHGSEDFDRNLRTVPIKDISEVLMKLSTQLKSNFTSMSIKDQENLMNFVRHHLDNASRLRNKLLSGYAELTELEQQVIDKVNSQINVSTARFRPKTPYKDTVVTKFDIRIRPNVAPLDLHRLIIVRSLIKSGLGVKYLKKLLGSERFSSQESKKVAKYSKLMQTMADKSESFNIGFPVIEKIIDQSYSGLLINDKFPFIEDWMKLQTTPNKLCIFVLGGISYNELKFAASTLLATSVEESP